MASFFNLILDTLAPSGVTLKINNGGDIFHVITGKIKILKPKIPVELLLKE